MPYEKDQSPDALIRQLPARHGGVSYAVLDEIEQFPILGIVNLGAAKIEWRRIQASAHLSLPAPVVSMTSLAFLLVYFPSSRYVHAAGIGHNRVLEYFRRLGNTHAQHPPCDNPFDSRRPLPGYQTT